MREAFRCKDPCLTEELRPRISALIQEQLATEHPSISQLNSQVLELCTRYFPANKQARLPRPSPTPDEKFGRESIAFGNCIGNSGRFVQLLKGVILSPKIRMQFRSLKRLGRQARRSRLEHLINLAQEAADHNRIGDVYRVVNALAPLPYDGGSTLPFGRGRGISCRKSNSSRPFRTILLQSIIDLPPDNALNLELAEIAAAITILKNNTAVPVQSPSRSQL